jgi:hypothetical protein
MTKRFFRAVAHIQRQIDKEILERLKKIIAEYERNHHA